MTASMTAPGALDGLRVLDLSTLFAAPQVATILGDFGADVVKVEPPEGDPLRHMGISRDGESLMWAMVGRNKRSLTLDPTTPDGQATLHRLVAVADVVVENQGPRVLAKWRATWEELSAVNPRLVMVSVSLYGATGPNAGKAGAGTLAEAFGGLTHMTGEADGPPMLPSIPLGDVVTSWAGAIGALVACWHRDVRGGPGQHVDVAMYEPMLWLMGGTIFQWDGTDPPPHRSGSTVPGGVPRNVYRTADDQYVVISGTTDQQNARLRPLLGVDTPEGAARYGTSAARLLVVDELDGMVADWVRSLPRDEVLRLLDEVRIPAAPVNDVPAILADPHIAARGGIVPMEHPTLGSLNFAAPFPVLGATPGTIRHPGPALGADTEDVLADWLR
jgi:crotonobetainyl-CoA:carnitine CoA-transferase CaiB-like acyl-CoA transferase